MVLFSDEICEKPASYYRQGHNDFSLCGELNRWLALTSSDSISIVYASAYASNPASAFGHVFLKFNNLKNADYLNIIVGYAANIKSDEFTLKYIFGGFGGAFTGVYNVGPFYSKIEEYNNMESRNLWSYELDLNSEQQYYLKLLLYEADKTKDKYYFLNRNCAYKIYEMLSKVNSKLKKINYLTTKVSPLYVLRNIQLQNSFKNQKFYPSLKSQYLAEAAQVSDIKERYNLKTDLQISILDLKKQSSPFLKAKAIKSEFLNKYDSDQYLADSHLFTEISNREIHATEFKINPQSNPIFSHSENKMTIQHIVTDDVVSVAYFSHTLLDPVAGYEFGHQFIFLEPRYVFKKNNVSIKIIDLTNLTSFTSPEKPISYKINFGIDQTIFAKLAMGLSQKFDDTVVYALPQYRYELNQNKLSFELGSLFHFKYNIHLLSSLTLYSDKNELNFEIQDTFKNSYGIHIASEIIFNKNVENKIQKIFSIGFLYYF